MQTSEQAVHTRGLSKRYGSGVLAVDQLDLNVLRGEVYGFLGPNGAGKTTTLRMLVGLIKPTAGSATVVGKTPGEPDGLARIGAIIEEAAFYPYLSGRDNLRVVARFSGVPESKIDGALEQVDLLARAKDRYGTYSTGMKQRLGVAAALLKDPELLILDEPTNGLDPQGMVEMRDLIRRVGQGERTVLLSSHLLNEVQIICDRVGVIQNGRMIAEGTVDELRGATELLVRAAPIEKGQAVVTEMLGADSVRIHDGALLLQVSNDRAGEVNRRLVTAGVDVTELRQSQRSLEEIFFQLTGEEQQP